MIILMKISYVISSECIFILLYAITPKTYTDIDCAPTETPPTHATPSCAALRKIHSTSSSHRYTLRKVGCPSHTAATCSSGRPWLHSLHTTASASNRILRINSADEFMHSKWTPISLLLLSDAKSVSAAGHTEHGDHHTHTTREESVRALLCAYYVL